MGIPKNYYLKGYVDDSRPGQIETLYQSTFSSEEKVLACCTLSPKNIFILVERLYWTSIQSDTLYDLKEGESKIILKYPFSQFWDLITDSFAIAQYSEEYGLALQIELKEKLNLENQKLPHFIRISFPAHSIGEEFDNITRSPHHADVGHFECRADIISHATYVEGMLYKIVADSKITTPKPINDMTYNEKIVFCGKEKLLSRKLLSLIRSLKNLRNESAHQFSFESDGPTGNYLKINPVSEKLLSNIKNFVSACEKRYGLKPGKIHRFHNSFRMLAGELNEKSNLTQTMSLTKQYPSELSSYFYG